MDVLEAFELQLSELEALKSIYPNDQEVVVDFSNLSIVKRYVETNGESFFPQKQLNISLNLNIDDISCILKIEVNLPRDYPLKCLPKVFLRCDDLTRTMQQSFNEDLTKYMDSLELGEMCLLQIIQWAVDNVVNYHQVNDEKVDERLDIEVKPDTFTRLWIYSHHIYNKEKRKSILEWAKELDLSGFSMPGKPGIICVEGLQQHCEEYWQRLRRQTWKRLSVVSKEESSSENRDSFQKFSTPVTEKDFGVHGGRDYHMDLGKFLEFLTEHESKEMFSVLFGVEGKTSSKS